VEENTVQKSIHARSHTLLTVVLAAVSGLFVPLHFRSRKQKLHRWNFRSRGTFVPWNIRSHGAESLRTFAPRNYRTHGTFASQDQCPKNIHSMELLFPGTFAPILKKIGGSITAMSAYRHKVVGLRACVERCSACK